MDSLQYTNNNKKVSFHQDQASTLELQYPIQLRVMSKKETKEYHLKKLYELSIKSLGKIPQLEDPTYEQKQWFISKMKARSFV